MKTYINWFYNTFIKNTSLFSYKRSKLTIKDNYRQISLSANYFSCSTQLLSYFSLRLSQSSAIDSIAFRSLNLYEKARRNTQKPPPPPPSLLHTRLPLLPSLRLASRSTTLSPLSLSRLTFPPRDTHAYYIYTSKKDSLARSPGFFRANEKERERG